MAKNKNQNRQRDQHEQRDQQGQRAGQRPDSQDAPRNPGAEEHGMPAATQAPRKQKQRFGHN
ncbi:hypothetical protein [Streptomyces sp. NBC_01190]|uniref:hypothetical protein n=1 Tax=Streptomyces sp. NBC_01190 TaxID=2903767 RepID=UPI00386A26D2|nr:hypothetical protein OG519_07720 [Streptomyces sp. NBC_01190]